MAKRLQLFLAAALAVVAVHAFAQTVVPKPPTNLLVDGQGATTCTGSPNTPGGSDGFGGCFPGPNNTGIPAGTTLTSYTGSCTITAANTVIDSKIVNCSPLIVGPSASGLLIKNSSLKGGVIQTSGSASFTIQDSQIDNGRTYPACTAPSNCAAGIYACGDIHNATEDCGVGYKNFTILRTEIFNTNRAAYCELNCLIQDSYFHGTNLWPDHTNMVHASGVRNEQGLTLRHNSLACDYTGPFSNGEIGCSADMSGYPDFVPIKNDTIENNLFIANNAGAGFCAYGGNTAGKPSSNDPTNATNIVFRNNVFQKGANGKCGSYGHIEAFDTGGAGNVWSGNKWNDGTTAPPN